MHKFMSPVFCIMLSLTLYSAQLCIRLRIFLGTQIVHMDLSSSLRYVVMALTAGPSLAFSLFCLYTFYFSNIIISKCCKISLLLEIVFHNLCGILPSIICTEDIRINVYISFNLKPVIQRLFHLLTMSQIHNIDK